jgi:hypothetical protein
MPAKATTVQLNKADLAFVERRGGRSHRGGGTFSRATVLHRALQALRMLVDNCDPRRTRGLSPAGWEVAIRKLPRPWHLSRLEVEHVGTILDRVAGMREELAAAGVDAEAFLEQVGKLNFAESVALVDAAICQQGPAALEPDDPE